MKELRPDAAGIDVVSAQLFEQVSALVEEARGAASRQVNATLVLRNWHTGRLISSAVLGDERGDYGKQIVASLSRQLTARYGRGFDASNLYRMVKFAREFPDEQILVSLIPELSWTHILALLPVPSGPTRSFYAEQAVSRRLSVQELRHTIARKAYERREIANSQIPKGSAMPVDAFRDPYLLDFLDLEDGYHERDLESAIIHELEPFLLEAGQGWAFIARQKRIVIDGEDFYIDLLFFSRPLRRLVVIELKIGRFQAAYKGQMELYLRWLDRYERGEGEEAPIGLILCTEAGREQMELLQMHKDGIVVAEYWTALPSKEQLEQRLQEILRRAKERVARQELGNAAERPEEPRRGPSRQSEPPE
ncbi:MAG: PDDEXK nuclease domain-containing protein [Propionibacteriaceae bacterium]|jgi:predicted nuclease of restriction endonuclease-like (RecB) superfamily|nr:PDDEXK nuclease domain-containing protein [Propionibacteriaceae bacterium]